MSKHTCQIQALTLYHENKRLTPSLSLTMVSGELALISGDTGTGKSLFAEFLYHRLSDIHHTGTYKLPKNRSWIPQNAFQALNPRRSVYLHAKDMMPSMSDDSICQHFESFGLHIDKLHIPAALLSTGQAQAAAIAVSLLYPVDLIIADDIFSGLDTNRQEHIYDRITHYRQQGCCVILFSTHYEKGLSESTHISFSTSLPHHNSQYIGANKGKILLTLSSICIKKHNQKLIHNLDLMIHTNERIAIIGKNGSGKSSLAHAIMQNTAYSGDMILNGQLIHSAKQLYNYRSIVLMHQSIQDLFAQGHNLNIILDEDFDKDYFYHILSKFNVVNWEKVASNYAEAV